MRTNAKYGLLSGLLCSAIFLTAQFSNPSLKVSGMTIVVLAIIHPVMIFLAVKERRKQLPDNFDFNEAMKTGLGATVLTAVLVSISVFVYYYFWGYDLMQDMIPVWKNEGHLHGMSDADINKAIEARKSQLAPRNLATFVMTAFVMTGGIATLVSSLILKKGKKS